MKFIIVKPDPVGTLYLRSITRKGKVWSLSFGDARIFSKRCAERRITWGKECAVPYNQPIASK